MNILKKIICMMVIIFGICLIVDSENTNIICSPIAIWNYTGTPNIDGFNLYYKPVDCLTTNVTKIHIYADLFPIKTTQFFKYFDNLEPNTVYLMTATTTKSNMESKVSNFAFYTNRLDTPVYPPININRYFGYNIIQFKILPYNGVTILFSNQGHHWNVLGHIFANKYGNINFKDITYNQYRTYEFILDAD